MPAEPHKEFSFEHRGHSLSVIVDHQGTLQLYLDGLLRKERVASGTSPQYVWTNVELQWEEHHYIEVRYWAEQERLVVTVNREPAHEVCLA